MSSIFRFGTPYVVVDALCTKTMYGYTAKAEGLTLHAGDFMYDKRGGKDNCFMFDEEDYRYRALMRHLGLETAYTVGYLLGSLVESSQDEIKFRITDCDNATSLLLCLQYKPNVQMLVDSWQTEACIRFGKRNCLLVVIDLACTGGTEAAVTVDDGLFDLEPDTEDVTNLYMTEEGKAQCIEEGINIAQDRLKRSGF